MSQSWAIEHPHTRSQFLQFAGGRFEAFRMALAQADYTYRNGFRDPRRRVRGFVVAGHGSLCLSELLWTTTRNRRSICRSRNAGRGQDEITGGHLPRSGSGGCFLWLI
jgi:hypothetical protein